MRKPQTRQDAAAAGPAAPAPAPATATASPALAAIPLFNKAKPWTTWLVVYWILQWVALLLSFIWAVYTLDVWPLAVWCGLSTTAVIAVHG